MLLKTSGIVFRTVKYGETSVITDIFTEENGLHTFIAGNVRAARSRMPFGLFQPMTVVELIAYYREGADALNRLKELRSGLVFSAIPFDIRRGAVTLFMAEICRKSIRESEENRPLFEFLLENLRWLDTTPHPIANLHLHFLLHLAPFLGFQPQGEPDAGETFFDLKEGVFNSEPPDHTYYLEPEVTQQVLQLLQISLEQSHEIQLNRSERKVLLNNLLRFYQFHVEGFTEINTPEILEMVL